MMCRWQVLRRRSRRRRPVRLPGGRGRRRALPAPDAARAPSLRGPCSAVILLRYAIKPSVIRHFTLYARQQGVMVFFPLSILQKNLRATQSLPLIFHYFRMFTYFLKHIILIDKLVIGVSRYFLLVILF